MRLFLLCLLSVVAAGFLPVDAQENIVQEFSGSGSTTTASFKVQNRWEVRWNARQVVSVAVMSPDGAIVAGAAGVLRGSLFVPLGGTYYFKISDGGVAPSADASSSSPQPAVSWHLQVVQLGKAVASDQALTVYTPYFMVPDSAITPIPRPAFVPPPVLTEDQIHSVVTIKGDNAQGAGFLMRSPEGTFVVTHLHLVAANPNLKIFTITGAQITTLSFKGAVDRDLALFAVQDNHYSYLPLSTDAANSISNGDQVIIPNLNRLSPVLVGSLGSVIAIGPERLDFNNRIGQRSTGAPVIEVSSGKVLALVTAEKKVDFTDNIAQAWPANPAPGSAGIIPCFGLRLSGVQGWETYDPARFLAETLFLKQFHDDTLGLDSYLNSPPPDLESDYGNAGPPPPAKLFFTNNPKITAACNTYKQSTNDADQGQQLDSARELLFDLNNIADTDMDTLQKTTELYAYDRKWAQEELAYRVAIKKELDDMSNNLVRFNNIAQTR